MQASQDTIIAQATPPGRGGVGIIRISGKEARQVSTSLLGHIPQVRKAEYLPFKDSNGEILDQGIALFFQAPHSFTGEDVLELQGHGGPVVMDLLMRHIRQLPNIRLARPGEFSERAFLNDKLDLTQAEAIADLIDSTSEQAARSALHSLQGNFSKIIYELVEDLTQLRIYVEAAIDFPEDEVDFLSDGKISNDVTALLNRLEQVRTQAKQGSLMREGMKVVLAGKPNAGKSSLLNALAGREAAIVTDIAGTTRDVLREHIHIDGMPLHIIDTAGLRESTDKVEQIGIERAWKEIEQADRVLLLVDASQDPYIDPHQIWPDFVDRLKSNNAITVVRNKIDLNNERSGICEQQGHPVIRLSAATNDGLETLTTHLKQCMGYTGTTEGGFIARQRHLEALEKANQHILMGQEQLEVFAAGELLAEELRMAQQALSKITGEFSSDDLLGRIFSSFCIGK